MRFMRCSAMIVLGLAALAVGACEDDDGITDPREIAPAALVRFVNAVPDTGTVDLRFIDIVENLPTFLGVPFRGSSGLYQRVTPGTRPVRVFVNSTNPVETQKRLIDGTITLEADKRYTLVYAGRARGDQDELAVIEDPLDPHTPPAGTIGVKALNAAIGMGTVDVYIAPSSTEDPSPDAIAAPSATISNVAYLSQSAYVNLATRPTGDTLSRYTFAVTTAGGGTALFSTAPRLLGEAAPAGASYGPKPGVQIPGSVITAIIVAAPTVGSPAAAADTAIKTATVVLLPDKPLNP